MVFHCNEREPLEVECRVLMKSSDATWVYRRAVWEGIGKEFPA
ncbi:MAG: hypothetical protein QXI55_01335 [Thermofilum sp.]